MVSLGVTWVLFVLTLATQSQVSSGDATLTLRLDRYNNPEGDGANGHCCDGRSIFCSGQCDHFFTICLDRPYSTNYGVDHCPLGRHVTGVTRNQNRIVFGGNIGGTSNPQSYHLDRWLGGVLIKVNVDDRDGGTSNDFVESLKSSVRTAADGISTAAVLAGRTTLHLTLTARCGSNYYGNDCSELCNPPTTLDHYTCDETTGNRVCSEGYYGEQCAVECSTDESSHHDCNTTSGYKICHDGWEGASCDRRRNPCAGGQCLNRAQCVGDLERGNYTCICQGKYKGVHCELPEKCEDNPCEGPSECYDTPSSSFYCFCDPGWSGDRCEEEVNVCESEQPCVNGECHEMRTQTAAEYECQCYRGWRGTDCHIDIDECEHAPCDGSQTCRNTGGSYECYCENGGEGVNCITSTLPPATPTPGTPDLTTIAAATTTKTPTTAPAATRLSTASIATSSLPSTGKFTVVVTTERGEEADSVVTERQNLVLIREACSENLCQNGGDCWVSADAGRELCTCTEHYSGEYCQHRNTGRMEEPLFAVRRELAENERSLDKSMTPAAARYVRVAQDSVTIKIIFFDCKDYSDRATKQVMSVEITVNNKWISSTEALRYVIQDATGDAEVAALTGDVITSCRASSDADGTPVFGAKTQDGSDSSILFVVVVLTVLALLTLLIAGTWIIHKRRQKKKAAAESNVVNFTEEDEEEPGAGMLGYHPAGMTSNDETLPVHDFRPQCHVNLIYDTTQNATNVASISYAR